MSVILQNYDVLSASQDVLRWNAFVDSLCGCKYSRPTVCYLWMRLSELAITVLGQARGLRAMLDDATLV